MVNSSVLFFACLNLISQSHSPYSDLWSDTEQDLSQTMLECLRQTYESSESEYAVQHIFFNQSIRADQETSIADDSDHPHAEFLRYL